MTPDDRFEASHPNCVRPDGHTCVQPSGRVCIETGCDQPAGTGWGPYWCPEHDAERLDRITRNLETIAEEMRSQ